MHWNHRVVRLTEPEEILFFAEVFYDDDGKPTGYTEIFLGSETKRGLRKLVERLDDALKQPVLDDVDIASGSNLT